MNIKEVLKFAQNFLSSSETVLLDSEVLLAHALGVPKEYFLTHIDEQIDENMLMLFKRYLQRFRDGEPVAYITNEKEFFGLDFYVDERVLVPRPETEELVTMVCDFLNTAMLSGKRRFKLLDVGTGSANIPIAIAMQFEDFEEEIIERIDAIDISEEALEVAQINIEQNSLSEKISLLQSDLLEELEDGESYDVITANLPYIATDDGKRFVAQNVEKSEPSLALFAGNDGLDLYKKMFQQLLDKSVEFKLFVGEFGFGQSDALQYELNKYFEQKWRIVKDLAGIDRFFIVRS